MTRKEVIGGGGIIRLFSLFFFFPFCIEDDEASKIFKNAKNRMKMTDKKR